MSLNPESWLRQQLWRLPWQGPGAVSMYLSIPPPLICVALSPIDSSQLALASLFVLSVNVALGVLFILADEFESRRHHNLGLLRFSAAKSRSRIEKLGVRSKQVDQFLNTLWFDHELELRFKKTRVRSVELMVLALDLLSRLASCYGRCGRRVFEANQTPIVNAMHLFESLPVAEAEKTLVEPLKRWLQDSPQFDPEGWALPLFRKF
jgi:hypothetical protein